MEPQSLSPQFLRGKTALVTGAAQRIGACIARSLHRAGANVALHYRTSGKQAHDLASELEGQRAGSVELVQADLLDAGSPQRIIAQVAARWSRLDVLVNNASTFYPTLLGGIDEKCWQELIDTNLKAPLFLSQAAAPALRQAHGCIVNMADIHAQRALPGHAVYCVAKAGLVMLTQALAKELAPRVRVNAVSPGAILPPPGREQIPPEVSRAIPLRRVGTPEAIADTVLFLLWPSSYVTGQIIAVDGGKSL